MNSDQGMLFSIVMKLHPVQDGTIPATVGHQAHAAFLDTVKRADAALAEVLHHPSLPMKPFTVSPLLGVPKAQEGRVAVRAGKSYALRFTILYQPIFQQFMRRFLADGTRPTIRLGDVEFVIREVLVIPGSHPWAGYASLRDLWQAAEPEPRLTLDFASPTAFSRNTPDGKKRFLVLPLPEAVFDSLARVWNVWSADAFDRQSLRDALAERAMVAEHNIRTRMLHYQKHPQLGFVGRVSFDLRYLDEPHRRQCAALADFAFYAGTGYKTTMGMGQTRRVLAGSLT